jgi:hypothetical protein
VVLPGRAALQQVPAHAIEDERGHRAMQEPAPVRGELLFGPDLVVVRVRRT